MPVVAVSGYFDPIHVGHIEYFKLAKDLAGDDGKLIVILNNDKQAIMKKGKVFMPVDERKRILESIRYVDEVYISIDVDRSVCKSIEAICPDIFANGGDRFIYEIPESAICRRLGIKMVDGLGEKIRSSSELIENVRRK
jgi:cytidyltransferase-like protein